MFILDTDHVSLVEKAQSLEGRRERARLELLPPEQRVTTIVSYEEQLRGWLSILSQARNIGRQIDAYARLRLQLENYCGMTVLEFDDPAAAEYQRLVRMRLRLKMMDLKIAAITMSRQATLLTRNVSDFGRVPGLRTEDWSREFTS